MHLRLKTKTSDRLILGLLIILSSFTIIAFGAVHVWAYTTFQIAAFTLLTLYLLTHLLQKESLTWISTPINPFLFLFIALILLQLLPLPMAILQWISPETAAHKTAAWKILFPQNPNLDWASIAYASHPVIREGLKLIAYITIFFLTLHLLNSRKRIDIFIYALLFMGLAQSVYSIHAVFSDSSRIWWWHSRARGGGFASGTFIVSNHFAFYLEMLIPLAFGFTIAQKGRNQRFAPGLSAPKDLVQRIVSWFAPESPNPKMLFLFFAAVIMGAALLLSGSRGGILSLSGAMLIMGVLFLFKRGYRRYSGFALLLCSLTFLYGLYIGIEPTFDKFERTQGLLGRLYTSKTLLPIIREYPAFGAGWGNLYHVYFRYMPENPPFPYSGVWSAGYAHNDWLEAGTETGFAGLFLLLGGYLYFLFRVIRVWKSRRDLHAVGIGAGGIAGLISVGFHSFFDFSLHIPANPTMLAMVGAVTYAALHRTGRGFSESFFYRKRIFRLTMPRKSAAALLTLLLAAGGIHLSWRHLMAEADCPTEWNTTLKLDWKPYLAEIEAAMEYNPINADYPFRRAVFFMEKGEKAGASQKMYQQAAVESLKRSLRLNPAAGLRWYALGRQYAQMDSNPGVYVEEWLPLADRCYRMARLWAPMNDDLLARAAAYWIRRSKTLSDETGRSSGTAGDLLTQKEGIERFQTLMKRLLSREPERWEWAVRQVWTYYPDESVLVNIVPPESPDLLHQVLQWGVAQREVG